MQPLPIRNPFRAVPNQEVNLRGVSRLQEATSGGSVQKCSLALQLPAFRVGGSLIGELLGGALFFQVGRSLIGSEEVLK